MQDRAEGLPHHAVDGAPCVLSVGGGVSTSLRVYPHSPPLVIAGEENWMSTLDG